jgi:hypothetical protein
MLQLALVKTGEKRMIYSNHSVCGSCAIKSGLTKLVCMLEGKAHTTATLVIQYPHVAIVAARHNSAI